jgi:type IX secretion system PorP/SprF family membrane protein
MSQFARKEFMRNPAAAGIVPGNNIHLFSRNDLPTALTNNQYNYFAASFDGANDSSRLGFGILAFFVRELTLSLQSDVLSAYTTALEAAFSYSTPLSSDVYMRFGGSVGIRLKSVPLAQVANGLFGTDSRFIPALSFGMLLQTPRARVGVAAFNLTNTVVTFEAQPQIRLVESRLYILQGKYTAFDNDIWRIEPAVALKVREDSRLPIIDLALMGSYGDKLLFGGGFRFGDIAPKPGYVVLHVGTVIGRNEIALSYDFPLAAAGTIALKYVEATFGVTL